MTYRLSLILSYLLCFGFVQAQDRCAANLHSSTQKETSHIAERPKTEITIPVVVHVIYSNAAQYISQEQIASQIAVLNQDFRQLNSDQAAIYNSIHTNRAADMEINFELASVDPSGNAHSGIIYRQVPPSFWNNPLHGDGRRKICYDDLNGSSAWCTDCYLNIWLADISIGAGMAIFPTDVGEAVPRAEDGVYIRHQYFGTTGSATAPYHLGRTATHEIGHYFNLLHLWGSQLPDQDCTANSCCMLDEYNDYVSDTPWQIKTYTDECPSGFQSSCGSAEGDNYQNFMGYSHDACLLMFTEGQKARVWDAINTYRSGFLDPNCQVSCTTATQELSPIDEYLSHAYYRQPYLELSLKDKNIHWQLFNIQGQILSSWTTSNIGYQQQVLPSLADGIYILMGQKNGQFFSKKLIVH